MKKLFCSLLSVAWSSVFAQDMDVARVIFSEASAKRSYTERWLIASVVANRVSNDDFKSGRLSSMGEVVGTGDFHCVGSWKNRTWRLTGEYAKGVVPADPKAKAAWEESLELAKGMFKPFPDICFYHDKSIQTPSAWRKKGVVLMVETSAFKFYRTAK